MYDNKSLGIKATKSNMDRSYATKIRKPKATGCVRVGTKANESKPLGAKAIKPTVDRSYATKIRKPKETSCVLAGTKDKAFKPRCATSIARICIKTPSSQSTTPEAEDKLTPSPRLDHILFPTSETKQNTTTASKLSDQYRIIEPASTTQEQKEPAPTNQEQKPPSTGVTTAARNPPSLATLKPRDEAAFLVNHLSRPKAIIKPTNKGAQGLAKLMVDVRRRNSNLKQAKMQLERSREMYPAQQRGNGEMRDFFGLPLVKK